MSFFNKVLAPEENLLYVFLMVGGEAEHPQETDTEMKTSNITTQSVMEVLCLHSAWQFTGLVLMFNHIVTLL